MSEVRLQYGRDGLDLDLSGVNATVIRPRFVAGLEDEAAAFRDAVRQPIGSRPLREIVGPSDRVAVVIADITRPLPSERLLPWLFAELPHLPSENVTIIVGTGSHRGNTPEEIESMVGTDIARGYRIINHNAHDPTTLAYAGESPFGYPVFLNRDYLEADKRIILGFVEPHLMAGFSGGYKAVFPGIVSLEAIMNYHGVDNIGHPKSTWGVLDGNPTQAHVRAGGALAPIDFCINLTLNEHREITRFFCGEVTAAHAQGCAFVRETSMVACEQPFPIVVTTNSGYPLDLNLYQSVKGMSAAAQVLAPGGLIVAAARCNKGFPEHGNFKRFLFDHPSPEAMLDTITQPGFSQFDQWQVQVFSLILKKARVALFSELPADEVRRAHLEPVDEIRTALDRDLDRIGREAPVAVLPEGPQTIPYLS